MATLREILGKHPGGLTIAAYQRHYVWGSDMPGQEDSVSALTASLLEAHAKGERHFLQSISVARDYLIDGQQRITYLLLALKLLGSDTTFALHFENRPAAEAWLAQKEYADIDEDPDEPTQDIYLYKLTLRTIGRMLADRGADRADFARYLLDNVDMLYIPLPPDSDEVSIYKMMNGTKAPMIAADLIKADLMRAASDPCQPNTYDWELEVLRVRYANEWDSWTRWWNRQDTETYYADMGERGLDLLLKLCLRDRGSDNTAPLTHGEWRRRVTEAATHNGKPYHNAKHFFHRLRHTQRRIEEAYTAPATYNKIKAIMLLQDKRQSFMFLHDYFVKARISPEDLEQYYKLSFLGMTCDEIKAGKPYDERFDDLLASLSMADVYHSDTKRDVFNLLLRLNIDEDTKLGRKFDFSVWGNRSLEHIYSKSMVWHTDGEGRIYDGNDNPINASARHMAQDRRYMHRDKIVNHDGTHLSEHCIGNLVLLYGQNNAAFGNADFEHKKMMFLAPGDQTVFQSRNLLHSVCVFAGNSWDHRSIVDNYNNTLRNLKKYYRQPQPSRD